MTHPQESAPKLAGDERAIKTSQHDSTSLLNAAKSYGERGWSIIPIGQNKQPTLASWKPYQTARPTEQDLQTWFADPSVTGLAVVLGNVSGGLACRDFDDGEASYEAWKCLHDKLARSLPTVKTARGYHVYFVAHGCEPRTLSNGELRAEGQYVILPPSRHPTGCPYTWLIPLTSAQVPSVDPVAAGLVGVSPSQPDWTRGIQGRQTVVPEDPVDPAIPVVPVSCGSNDWDAECKVVAHTIERCTITDRGQHDQLTMNLVRALKLELNCPSLDAARPVFNRWWEASRRNVADPDRDAAWGKFQRAFTTARIPPGAHNLAESALGRAKAKPPPPAADLYESPNVRLLVGLCYELSRITQGTFKLSCHQVGDLLGVSPRKAWEWFRMLCADGVLQCVDRGRAGHPGKGAATFAWLGNSRANEL